MGYFEELKAAAESVTLTIEQKSKLGLSRAVQVWGAEKANSLRFLQEIAWASSLPLDVYIKMSRVGLRAAVEFCSPAKKAYFWGLANTIN